MKKIYTSLLLFYLILHFVIPLICYYFLGFVTLYSELEFSLPVLKGIALNFIMVLGTIIVIQFLPDKKEVINTKYNYVALYLIISILIIVSTIVQSGGYENVITGGLNGTIISYISLFFDSTATLLMFLFFQKNIRYGIVMLLIYVLLMTISGSRSAIIIIVIAALIMPMFSNYQRIKKSMRRLIAALSIISPLLFYYATSVRGDIDNELIGKVIVGRLSMVEVAGLAIDGKDNKTMNSKLFDSKYGFVNQFKQSVDEVTPIDPFEHDINPNQYYRAIFKGASEDDAAKTYMSMNMTLPVYFYLKTNFILASIISILLLSSIYYFWVANSKNVYILIVVVLNLYYLLQYFDWIMITASVYRTVLTIFALNYFEKGMHMFKLVLKNEYKVIQSEVK